MAKLSFGIPYNPVFGNVVVQGSTGVTFSTSGAGDFFHGGGSVTGASGAVTIGTAANRNITLAPNGSGKIIVGDNSADNSVMIFKGNTNYPGVLYIQGDPTKSASTDLIFSGNRFGVPGGFQFYGDHHMVFSGPVLFGTSTLSSNGIIQLTPSTLASGGIAWGTRAAEVIYRTANDQATIGFTTLTFSGGLVNKTNVQTTSYQILVTDYLVVANSGSSLNLTLPATPTTGQTYVLKNKNSGVATIVGNGANLYTTSAVSSYPLSNGDSATAIFDGTVWCIV